MNNTIELLPKGGNIVLADKIEAGLTDVRLGLAWDETTNGKTFDADAIVVLVGEDGKVTKDGAVYYGLAASSGQPFSSKCGSVRHSGDNLIGDATGDDEQIVVTLDKVPANIAKVVFIAHIHQGAEKGQNFGQNSEAIATLYNNNTEEVIARVDLKEDNSTSTGVVVCELYRHNGSWKFRSLLKSVSGTLSQIVNGEF